MSSFRPGGADSDSTSVTKPYLYSCLTRLSIVSVAVLMINSFFLWQRNWHTGHARQYRNGPRENLPVGAWPSKPCATAHQIPCRRRRNSNGNVPPYSGRNESLRAGAAPAEPNRI